MSSGSLPPTAQNDDSSGLTAAAAKSTLRAGPEVSAGKRYIYCIINAPRASSDAGPRTRSFGPIGISSESPDGADRPEVFTLAYKSVAAVISVIGCPAGQDSPNFKFEISRANVLTHYQVMERVLEAGFTVLPVKFNTIAEPRGEESAEDRLRRCVLEPRQEELTKLLTVMKSRTEMGVKGLWADMKTVFQDIAQHNPEIDSRRKRIHAAIATGQRAGAMALQMRLGEMVKKALDNRKATLEQELVRRLSPLTVGLRRNKTFGDPMFTNLALLVERSAMAEVEAVLTEFEAGWADLAAVSSQQSVISQASGSLVKAEGLALNAGPGPRPSPRVGGWEKVSGHNCEPIRSAAPGGLRLRCVGPVPPSNFVELVITWDE